MHDGLKRQAEDGSKIGTVARHRAARRVLRLVSSLALWKRNACVEGGLRMLFGDVTEAAGHLFHIDPRDRTVGVFMRRRGIWSPSATLLYSREVRPDMCVVDAGANLGYFTLLFARLVGSSGRVFAFEPEPTNAALLSQNVGLNGYSNVTIVGKALLDNPGELPLYLSTYNYGDHRLSSTEKSRKAIKVPVTTLDEFFPAGTRVDFIKLDIQGAERSALIGARRVLADNPRIGVATEYWPTGMRECGDDPRGFLRDFVELGFEISVLGAGNGELILVSGSEALDRLAARNDTVDLFCVRGH